MVDRPRWLTRALVAVMLVVFLAQAFYFTRTLVFSDDEEGYLVLGDQAARGTISLFQDDVLGARTPLPFYVLGWPQRLTGPNLWAARLVSVVFAAGALWLTIRTATILGGAAAGLVAGFLLATQGATVGYFATAGYHAISAFVVLAILQPLIGPPFRGQYLLVAASTGLLFLTRTHISPLIPLLLAVCVLRSDGWRARVLVLLLGAATPLIFFLSDPTHVKLLAYAGPLSAVAARWGYRSIFYFYDFPSPPLRDQLRSLLFFPRRYESLALAAGGLLLAAVWNRGRLSRLRWWPIRRDVRLVTLVFVYGVGCLFLIVAPFNLKVAIAYFPAYAPLAAVLLGIGSAHVFESAEMRMPARVIAAVALGGALVVSVVFPRQPLLPTPPGRLFQDDAIGQLDALAGGLQRAIPPNSRVFLVGDSMPLYLADRLPYIRQMMYPTTLAGRNEDPYLVQRSGVWGRDQIEEWLGSDATYAVVAPRWVEALRPNRARNIARIEELLASRFSRTAVLDDYLGAPYQVYRRNAP